MEFENLKLCNFGEVGKGQATISLRYVSNKEIAKVLAIKCESTIFDHKIGENQVSYKGRAECKLIFLDTNGEIQSSSFFTEFNDALSSNVTEGSHLFFKSIVVDTNHSLSANIVVVNSVVEVSAYAFSTNAVSTLCGGVNILTSPKTYCQSGTIHKCALDVESQWQLDFEIDSILSCSCFVSLDGCTSDADVVTATGRGYLHLACVSHGAIKEKVLSFDVNGQCLCQTAGGTLVAQPTVKNTKLHVEGAQETTTLFLDVVIGLEIAELTSVTKEIAQDAYSTTHHLELGYEQTSCTKLCGTMNFVAVTNAQTNGENFVCVALSNVVLTNTVANVKSITCEGVASVVLLYKGEEYWSQELEIPFSHTAPVDFANEKCMVMAHACLGDVTAVVNGESVEVVATVNVSASCFETQMVKTLSKAEIGKELPSRSAIEICMAKKGETLWQLGKSMGVDVDEITAINPELSNPLEKDTKIVLYHKID